MKRYTEQEDKYILKEISKGYGNLNTTFKKVAKQLNRTPKAIHYRWYYVLNNPENKKYVGAAFVMMSKESVSFNKKITNKRLAPITANISIWQKILNFFKK